MSERGSSLPVLAFGLALVVLGALLLGAVGRAAGERARAQTAADAAALAAVVEGRPAAVELARANGGELVSFRLEGGEVVVEVRVGRAVARARAGLEFGGGHGSPLPARTLTRREV